ncbi:hypothetical protein DFR55_1253 [Herbinix hemicellulosilytica]|uniref:4Fe-4S ferredoxin-type domain-containing protein n=1 Tax=Herbinix hemicellulosilytica TaxID=1564487 RepID=A0A0H5SH20_HERHM|nr:aldo/keto reductase [Herbinix hemicellulosilytica]RBP57280.1 hypothetical protein DFR55_1253 [Herbinix hemicellulosilytica]CRZ34802.1 hypothetical protein HHT355_1601 [Herbinix hemicellulosilytica]
MEYRKIPNIGVEVSLLGFGCMRFPVTKEGKIDETKALKMIDLAYKNGVNYFDTAYFYHNGESEKFTGKALSRYDRSSFYLATKLPCSIVKSIEDAERIFNEQLQRLQTDYVDFYLLHAVNRKLFDQMVELGVPEFCENLRKQGKIRYFGFSFHDDYDAFEYIVRYRKWDFCQLQLNYMDMEEQAGFKGYKLAEELGIPVIVMEPVKGGNLAKLPRSASKYFKALAPDKSISSFALRYVGTLPNVKVILSGMTTLSQVSDNLNTFDNFAPLNDVEMEAVEKVRSVLKARVNNSCTACRYCMPCPAGVDIPRNFALWNKYGIYRNKNDIRWNWQNNFDDKLKAKNCVQCGKCEKVCPQKISIRKDLQKLQNELDVLCAAN